MIIITFIDVSCIDVMEFRRLSKSVQNNLASYIVCRCYTDYFEHLLVSLYNSAGYITCTCRYRTILNT